MFAHAPFCGANSGLCSAEFCGVAAAGPTRRKKRARSATMSGTGQRLRRCPIDPKEPGINGRCFYSERYCSRCSSPRRGQRDRQHDNDQMEIAMTGVRSQRALARAQQILALAQPPPQDADAAKLRELASRYIDEAERWERENGEAVESEELVSAALDNVARDYFAWAVRRAREQAKK